MQTYLADQLRAALARLADLPEGFDPAAFEPEFQTPNNPEHGDLATNAALQLARPLRRAPRAIADALAEALVLDPQRVTGVEVAGPGFLNFRFAADHLSAGVAEALRQGERYGRTEAGAGKTAIVEYVSANPTGPLTVGHGRNAVLGDTLANLLDWTGYDVTREYYFNDAGRQMRILGESVRARYEALVQPDLPTDARSTPATGRSRSRPPSPRTATSAATSPRSRSGSTTSTATGSWGTSAATTRGPFKDAAQEAIFADIEATMHRLGIRMDTYFNEFDLYESDAVWRVVESLRQRRPRLRQGRGGMVQDGGAREDVNDEPKDTVLVKSSGEPTYRLPDIAYHLEKLSRGFDRVVDVFGADHIATYPDVLRGVEALGGDASKIEVVVYQFVTLVRGGEPVKMSTRKANYVTLDELMDEVGPDVVRFFFLMLSPGTHLNFDLDLAKEAGEKNPVFYLQYAHARISSILQKAEETGVPVTDAPDWALLTHESETVLMKEVLRLPEAVARSAEAMEPHRLASFLRDVATAFSQFYRDCRIVGEPEDVAAARLALARAARITLRNGLAVLGISAPERM
jgi:arginyl-tRNA synthetase